VEIGTDHGTVVADDALMLHSPTMQGGTMNTTSPSQTRDRDELAIPNHLARYLAEVEMWRLEALAARAARIAEEAYR
jgi:hypothetical protein